MKSLGLRISVGVALGQLLALGLAILLGYQVGARVLTGQFDDGLVARAEAYLGFVEQELSVVTIDRKAVGAIPPPPGDAREYLQLWRDDGLCVYRSPELEGGDLVPFDGVLGERHFSDDLVADGVRARVFKTRVRVANIERSLWNRNRTVKPREILLTLTWERTQLDQAQGVLLTGLFAGGLLILCTAAVVSLLVARRGLAPLRAFGRRVQELDVSTLEGRFDSQGEPRELLPLVDGLNDLRERVDAALRREKRLGATIAHEFRTPISELRALAQVALGDLEDTAFTRQALEQVEIISERLVRLLELTRRMAQLGRRDESLEVESIDLGDLLREELGAFEEQIEADGKRIDLERLEEVQVEVNRMALTSVIQNLLRNAVEYGPQGSTLRGFTERGPDGLRLHLENPCEGLGPEHLAHLTEPFWRLDPARDDPERHGLGLTIAHGMAVLAGVDLGLQVRDGVFSATLTFPTTGDNPAA